MIAEPYQVVAHHQPHQYLHSHFRYFTAFFKISFFTYSRNYNAFPMIHTYLAVYSEKIKEKKDHRSKTSHYHDNICTTFQQKV